MPRGKPGERRHFKIKHVQNERRGKEYRETVQRLKTGYEQDIIRLTSEIKKARQTLHELDIARDQGNPIDPNVRSEAVKIVNTASARLGIINQRLRSLRF
jgi:predicted transcriptional regulator